MKTVRVKYVDKREKPKYDNLKAVGRNAAGVGYTIDFDRLHDKLDVISKKEFDSLYGWYIK